MATSRPSRWWVAAAVVAVSGALVLAVVSALVHDEQTRPIGEGELFLAETERIVRIVEAGDPATTVRVARNELDIEAVSVVSVDGVVSESTSGTLVGIPLQGFLGFAHGSRRLAAVAAPTPVSIEIDGVAAWTEGDTLYAVLRPLDDGRSVIAHYDVSQLLARRVNPPGLHGPALWMAVLAGVAALAGFGLLLGRDRAVRRYREAVREAELAREHSRDLEEQNVHLDAARASAERALALAEEKHRIRSEFVLMINHELRTPLTAVTTGARLLDESHLTDDDRRLVLDGMLADSERLERIIDHVLAVARIENQGIQSPLVSQPVADVVDFISTGLPRDVSVEVGEDLAGLSVVTDRQTLVHLLGSLADNATTHGAARACLVVGTEAPADPDLVIGPLPADGLYLSVVDDGPGIDPSFLPRAFEKFEKRGFTSGTGLGLYLARLMAEAIGAGIAVRTDDHGTTMAVALPVSRERVEVTT